VSIEELVNGQEADAAPGVTVPVGSVVTFTYQVTNTGASPFPLPFVVVDDNGTPGLTSDDFLPALTLGTHLSTSARRGHIPRRRSLCRACTRASER